MFDITADAPAHAARSAGMNEPGIFKGCTDADGPLAAATKDAILAYLGKPNAAAWSLKHENSEKRTNAFRPTECLQENCLQKLNCLLWPSKLTD